MSAATDFLDRILDPIAECFTPEVARRLAESTQDAWAARRMDEGWTYGPKRDDDARKHPDLIPYADLPDGEKQYDRAIAVSTLKAIVALGYKITKG